MYHHVKKLMYTVRIGEPDPQFGRMLLEQFGGANGELAAAMQYSVQGLNCDDPARKDLLMDIGTEELSHLEVIGTLARMHLKPAESSREAAEADPLDRGLRRRRSRALQLAGRPRGRPTISRSPASSTWTCAATSPPRRGPRSSTSGSSISPTTPAPRTRFSSS